MSALENHEYFFVNTEIFGAVALIILNYFLQEQCFVMMKKKHIF